MINQKTNIYDLENQVCTLDQSKKLAELLGEHASESLWVWSRIDGGGNWGIVLTDHYVKNPIMHWSSECYNAYTGDELGVLLPKKIEEDEIMIFLGRWFM